VCGGGGGGGGEARDTESKTRTPHKDVGNKSKETKSREAEKPTSNLKSQRNRKQRRGDYCHQEFAEPSPRKLVLHFAAKKVGGSETRTALLLCFLCGCQNCCHAIVVLFLLSAHHPLGDDKFFEKDHDSMC